MQVFLCRNGGSAATASHMANDLNYVANTVEGFVLSASIREAIGQTINLGSGREVGIGELAKLIGRLVGREISIETEAERVRQTEARSIASLPTTRWHGSS